MIFLARELSDLISRIHRNGGLGMDLGRVYRLKGLGFKV